MKTHAFRIHPGKDLRLEIEKFATENGIHAGVILTCVGNLTSATLRMADAAITNKYEGTFEIVSLVGTLEEGNSHLHIALSDTAGTVIGGHLKQGSLVGVTAEVVIGELENTTFTRELDTETGYEELVITNT